MKNISFFSVGNGSYPILQQAINQCRLINIQIKNTEWNV